MLEVLLLKCRRSIRRMMQCWSIVERLIKSCSNVGRKDKVLGLC